MKLALWTTASQCPHVAGHGAMPATIYNRQIKRRDSRHLWSSRPFPEQPALHRRDSSQGQWFQGEHAAIVDRKTFDQVQQLLASKSAGRKAHRTASEALLMGKLYDDRGNRMSPSFSTNKGVRYRFYVSSALLRGRKAEVGSIGQLAAQAIEEAVVKAVRNHLPADEPMNDTQFLDRHLSRVDLGQNELIVSLRPPEQDHADECNGDAALRTRLLWAPTASTLPSSFNPNAPNYREEPDFKAIQAIVRARHWASELSNGTYASVDELAASAKLNSKVVRNELRLAFLAPEVLDAILKGKPGCSLPDLRRIAAISWRSQRSELYENRCPPSDLNIKVP